MLILDTIKDAELNAGATVKESLTVQIELRRMRTAEESSVVQTACCFAPRPMPSPFYPSGFHE